MKNVAPACANTIVNERTKEWVPKSFEDFLQELQRIESLFNGNGKLLVFRGHRQREWLLDATFVRSCKSILFGLDVHSRLSKRLAESLDLHRVLLNLFLLKFGVLVRPSSELAELESARDWAAAGLVDTHLHSFSLHFELHGTEIPQRGVPPSGIVEAFNVIEHIGLGLGSRAVHLRGRAFGLQRGEDALHHRIVPDVARPTHAAGHAVVGQEALERLTRILAASIGVMQHRVGCAPPPDRHHERIGDQLRRHRRTHGPAHHPSREEIHDRGDIEPAFGGPEIREVGDPFVVRRGGGERPVEHIRSDGIRRAHRGVRWHPSPSGACTQGGLAHQPLNTMAAAGHAFHEQVVPDPPSTVGAIAGEEAGPHSDQQLLIGPCPDTRRPGPPGIEAGARDTERLTQPSRRPDSPVRRNEGELHSASFAK